MSSRCVRNGVASKTRLVFLAAVLTVLTVVCWMVRAPVARAAAVEVAVTGEELQANGETKLELRGSGFQSVQGGFGGIYVLFGWVDDPSGGSWRPSQGGVTGEDYRYAFDDETNPVGYQVFVAFPGSSTGYAANGGEVREDGTWEAAITVPGARFISYDRDQNEAEVDCLTGQCGIITIGAHGVQNANNETFTPVQFSQGEADATVSESASTATEVAEPATPATAPAEEPVAKNPQTPTAVMAPEPISAEPTPLSPSGVVWLVLAALLGLALIILLAGGGGYLAAKSLLLGVSPAALEREIGRRQRKADAVKAKQARKRARSQKAAARRLARIQQDATDTSVLRDPIDRRTVVSANNQALNLGDTQNLPAVKSPGPADLSGFFSKSAEKER